eukprot:m.157001 g.157001  ORF g.157001 m.157001 type:complete len:77 (+) comp20842_c0_seq1:3505-3735(+)
MPRKQLEVLITRELDQQQQQNRHQTQWLSVRLMKPTRAREWLSPLLCEEEYLKLHAPFLFACFFLVGVVTQRELQY